MYFMLTQRLALAEYETHLIRDRCASAIGRKSDATHSILLPLGAHGVSKPSVTHSHAFFREFGLRLLNLTKHNGHALVTAIKAWVGDQPPSLHTYLGAGGMRTITGRNVMRWALRTKSLWRLEGSPANKTAWLETAINPAVVSQSNALTGC